MNPETNTKELRYAFRFFDYDIADTQLSALVAQCIKPELFNNTTIARNYPDHIQELWEDLRARHAAQFDK